MARTAAKEGKKGGAAVAAAVRAGAGVVYGDHDSPEGSSGGADEGKPEGGAEVGEGGRDMSKMMVQFRPLLMGQAAGAIHVRIFSIP